MENKNISAEISWLDRDIGRFKKERKLIPPIQKRIYEKIRDHWTNGRTAIDLGCSIGYGSNILSHDARHVWGVDINEEAIEFAKYTFARPNLSFDVMDIESPPNRPLSNFNIVICMEVLEHLVDPQAGINTIKSFFSDKLNTVGFITAPNVANQRIARADAKNHLHLNHWKPGEFYSMLIEHFRAVTMFSGDKVNQWVQEETVDGDDTSSSIIVAKVEGTK